MFLNNNQLIFVEDTAPRPLQEGVFDFRDGESGSGAEYGYDGNGSMLWDRNKGITYMLYDDWGNVRTVQFREGGQIEYVYTAEGEKLKKRVKTSTIPLTRSYGVYDDSQATLVQVDSVIYTGNLVLEQGESPKVLFLRLTMWIIVVWNIIRQ